MIVPNPYSNTDPYIPASISEIYDLLGSMILGAPTFIDRLGHFPERNIDSQFHQLTEGLGIIRKKIGEDRYLQLIELSRQAKILFAADQDDMNGQTDAGRNLLFQIEGLLIAARRGRLNKREIDDEGKISDD